MTIVAPKRDGWLVQSDVQPPCPAQAHVEGSRTPTLFLDMDGVLADFDAGANAALGTDNSYKWEWIHGTKAFWQKLFENPNFFGDLPPMSDALHLFGNVRHLRPVVLTALPKSGADEVDAQKRAWIAKYLGPDVPVITCLTHEKPGYCQAGDILVDDRAVNQEAWNEAGGRYVHHVSAVDTLAQLRKLEAL